MTPWVLSLFLAFGTGSGLAAAQPSGQVPPVIRLYVFTANAPSPGDKANENKETDLKDRIQATEDIINWLKDKKKKTISVVDQKDAADVRLEVLAVQHAPGMTLGERTSGYLHGPRYETWTVRAKITAGTFSNELAKQGQFPALAAEAVADDVEKWTRDNRDSLVAARPKRDN